MVTQQGADTIQLVGLLGSLHPLSADIVDFIQQKASYKAVRKGKMLLKSGEV